VQNDRDNRVAAIDFPMSKTEPPQLGCMVRPTWACDSWGASPLYENEDLKEGSIPTVTPIEQVRDEGNCGEVTNRGEEAVRRLMRPDDMRETFSELAVKEPDLMRLVLQACVAALVNVQSVEAVGSELKRRAVVGN